jgi:hypothetical protein
MASHHATTPQAASKLSEAEHRTTKLVAFWKLKEKPSEIASPPSSPSSPSTPSPPPSGPSQTKPINIPQASASSGATQEINSINAHAQLRTSNNVTISATISVNTSSNNNNYSTTPTLPTNYIQHRARTNSEAIPSHSAPINLQNRLRSSQEGDIVLTNPAHSTLPNGIEAAGRRLNNSAGVSHASENSQHKNNPSSSSSSSNPIKHIPTAIRSTSLQSVQENSITAKLSHRRRSLNEHILSGFSLQLRPKSAPKPAPNDEISMLLAKIQESENLLNELETKLKKETMKRVDNRYSKYDNIFSPRLPNVRCRELEDTLQKGEADKTKTGEAEQQILQELENFKQLEARYREVLEEVSASKDALEKLTERLSSMGTFSDMPQDCNLNKRRWVRM